MTPSKVGMYEYEEQPSTITMANGSTISVEGHGSVDITVWSYGAPRKLKLTRVLYSPDLSYNLFSLVAAVDTGNPYQGEREGIVIYGKEGGEILFPRRGNTNYIDGLRISYPR